MRIATFIHLGCSLIGLVDSTGIKKGLRVSVFKDKPKDTQVWPTVFTKVPETVVATGTDVRLPGDVFATGSPAGVGMGMTPAHVISQLREAAV